MRLKSLFGVLLLCSTSMFAQLTVNPTNNATTLANQLRGDGLIINSASLTCPNNAAGVFSNGGTTTLGISSGIVLTTGLATDAIGNASNGFFDSNLKSFDNPGGSIPQLEAIIPNAASTEDGCYLDISVVPTCSTLTMRYVFGSEEYPDYVGTSFNDVFGFFVSGPNPGGGNYVDRNIAIVPGSTSTAVAINSVNNGSNNNGPCTNCAYYVNNSNSTTIAYDGLTTPLTATLAVVPCATYNIRLAIADVGDGLYDSGVFIEASSVSCSVNLTASASPATICVGQSTTLTASISGVGSGTYSWSTGQSGQTITVSPTATTTYTAYYTYCGATESEPVTVNVNQVSGATFQYTSSTYCKGTSNPTPINVANGTTFSASPAGLVFTNTTTGQIDLAASASGTYTISLAGTGACPSPATQQITIQDAPTATLTGSGSICSGQTVPLTVSFVGTAPFTFSVDSAGVVYSVTTNSNPYVINAGAVGSYSISNLSDAGCPGTVSGSATVGSNPLPTATFSGGSNFCQGTPPSPIIINLTGTSPFSLSYTENGTPITQTVNGSSFTYTPSGSVDISFTGISDATTCSSSLNQLYNIIQYPLPSGNVSGGGSVCFGSVAPSVVFNLISGTAPWNVSYSVNGGPNQNVVVNTSPFSLPDQVPGTYTISLITDANSCQGNGTGSAQISYFPGVTATVSSSLVQICQGQTASVNASGGVIATWTPQPTQSSSSSYNLVTSPAATTDYTITIDDGNGCKDTAIVKVVVNPKPLADFNASAVCFGTPTSFTNTSTIPSGSSITNYLWGFEAGNTSNQINPQFSFSSCGNYQVSLLAVSSSGCRDSITKSVVVNCLPQANFSIDDTIACVNQVVNFTNTSVAAFGSSSQWTLGNGQFSSNINAFASYSTPGTYSVTLLISTPDGCQDSRTQSLDVLPKPTADFTSNTACLNSATFFTNNSISNPLPITNYQWTFDINAPGNNSSLQDPTFTYASAQNYTAQLIAIDANGCSDTVRKTVVVKPLPIASFNATDVCLGLASQFISTSTISDNSPLTYSWDFQSDGQIDANITSPNYTYLSAGVYNATLYVTSNNGCRDSIQKQVNVYDYPVVNFSADTLSGCEPLNVNFSNASTVANPSNIAAYSWYVNGVRVGFNENLDYTFLSGVYTIKLVVVSNHGCKDSTEYVNYIVSHPKPIANFDFFPKEPTILNSLVSFTDMSLGTISTWSWDFGDNNYGKLITDHPRYPEYAYTDTGKINVTLLVTTDQGCTDSITKTIRIRPEFIIYIPNAFTPNGDMVNNTFFPKGVGIDEKEGYIMFIYDRWGNQIFSTNDWFTAWNGKFDNTGDNCMADTYIYKIYVKDVLGKKHQFVGHVNLIR